MSTVFEKMGWIQKRTIHSGTYSSLLQIKKKLDYLESNSANFSRERFYNEFSLIIRFINYHITHNKNIFSMTLDELSANYPNQYLKLFEEVYFCEYDDTIEDSINKRQLFIKQCKTLFEKGI